MPYKDRALQRDYQNEWTKRRRAAWLAQNGPCACGSWEQLQVDHKDPATKVTHRIWTWSKARREVELAKCQVLCLECHKAKCAVEAHKDYPCGSARKYWTGCRCALCRRAGTIERYLEKERAGDRAPSRWRTRFGLSLDYGIEARAA